MVVFKEAVLSKIMITVFSFDLKIGLYRLTLKMDHNRMESSQLFLNL